MASRYQKQFSSALSNHLRWASGHIAHDSSSGTYDQSLEMSDLHPSPPTTPLGPQPVDLLAPHPPAPNAHLVRCICAWRVCRLRCLLAGAPPTEPTFFLRPGFAHTTSTTTSGRHPSLPVVISAGSWKKKECMTPRSAFTRSVSSASACGLRV